MGGATHFAFPSALTSPLPLSSPRHVVRGTARCLVHAFCFPKPVALFVPPIGLLAALISSSFGRFCQSVWFRKWRRRLIESDPMARQNRAIEQVAGIVGFLASWGVIKCSGSFSAFRGEF